jgi:hypothetical protein
METRVRKLGGVPEPTAHAAPLKKTDCRLMPKRYKTEVWMAQVPDKWSVSELDGQAHVEMRQAGGAGVLDIIATDDDPSAWRPDGELFLGHLYGKTGTLSSPAFGRFCRWWTLSCGGVTLYINYRCATASRFQPSNPQRFHRLGPRGQGYDQLQSGEWANFRSASPEGACSTPERIWWMIRDRTDRLKPQHSSPTSFDLSGRFVPGDSDRSPSFGERLSERAHFLYLNSAAVHGHDVDHWLLAEHQTKPQNL